MNKLIEVSIFGEASVENNKVVVDYSELKKVTENYFKLLEALKTLVSHIHFDRGHDCETVMDGGWSVYDKAEEAIKQAEAE